MPAAFNKTILIIEDEVPMLNALSDKLMREGFVTIQAKDGSEGLRIALQKHPDLILLDIVMPKMDGMTMMEELRKDSWGAHVPIVLLTNLNADEKIMKGVTKHEPAYYLVKSDWQISDVIERVKERLGLLT